MYIFWQNPLTDTQEREIRKQNSQLFMKWWRAADETTEKGKGLDEQVKNRCKKGNKWTTTLGLGRTTLDPHGQTEPEQWAQLTSGGRRRNNPRRSAVFSRAEVVSSLWNLWIHVFISSSDQTEHNDFSSPRCSVNSNVFLLLFKDLQ